ncbi:MAG: hypothetical protein DMG13_19645 [Acidobacteria bacterium]|nr:MAG: hypothetical protein DMG13_19645 [Acidobacteriota bacterium]
MRLPDNLGQIFGAAMKLFDRLALYKEGGARSSEFLETHTAMPVDDRPEIVRRYKDLARRESNTAGNLSLFKSLFKSAEEFLMRLFKKVWLVKNQHCGIRIIQQAGLHRLDDWHRAQRARKEFAIVGKHELLVEIFLIAVVVPTLARTAAPLAKHFAADHDVLHRKYVDVLNRTARPLVIQIEFSNRIHTVAEKLNADRIAH